MANGKNTIVVYRDWTAIFQKLTDEEAGRLIKHFFGYVNDENPCSDRLTELLFEPIKLTLKRDLKNWESVIEKRSQAGKRSAELRQQNQQMLTHVESVEQTSTNSTDSVTVTVTDSVSVTDKEVNIYIQKDHLLITWDEMNKLIDEFGEVKADEMIRRVLNYRKNTKYKSLYLTALNWLKKEKEEQQPTTGEKVRPKLSA